jgi:DNA-3-methyladenine glycosylase
VSPKPAAPEPPPPLPSAFYRNDTVEIARQLLGCLLWRRIGRRHLVARIVETEAYLGANDPASHARGGLRSARNESMYLHGGHAYVYFTYGMHWCMNVVTGEADIAEAVLLRGAEPVRGIEWMRANRPRAKRDHELMNGPGKLCQALEIDRALDGEPLNGTRLFLTAREQQIDDAALGVSPRVGVSGAGDAAHWPLRFFVIGSRHVSPYRL